MMARPDPVLPRTSYEIKYIPVKNLSVVWVQAQRPYNEKWAKEIADNLDPDKFDPLIVTLPNGENVYHIIEGQHRRHALEIYAAKINSATAENELCPCRVIDEADPQRAAELWLGYNAGRKAVKPIIGFSVAVVAGREKQVTINRIVERVGFRISSAKAKNCISAVSALGVVYDRHGRETLEHTLRTLKNLWDDDPHAVAAVMLRGFGIFIHEFSPYIDIRRLRARVGLRFTPWKFKEWAAIRKQASAEPLDVAMAETLVKEYNTGAREGAKLKRKT
jgi:hypothetical protein